MTLYEAILDAIYNNGPLTAEGLEKKLQLDFYTIQTVINCLIKDGKVQELFSSGSCCNVKKNCSGCNSITRKKIYLPIK